MDRRFIQLFKILSNQNGYMKSEELCAKLDIRPRTLREDIRQYKDTLEKEAGCFIESKPNAGYHLNVFNEERYNAFVKTLLQEESNNQYLIPVHQEERINYIIRYFLSHHDYVKLNDLADEIYISRSTLNADIKEVKKRLSYFHLTLASKPSYGLKIAGKEKDIRSCIAQYFYHFNNYDQQYMDEMNIHSSYIDQDAFAYIKNVLYETISKYKFKLTDFGFQNLSIHIFIAVNRIMGKTYVEEYISEPDFFKGTIEAQIASDIAAKLNDYFHILVPSSEIHYITIHLMGKQSMHLNDQQLVLEEETTKVTEKILEEIKNNYQIDFTKDLDLYTLMNMHIQPMLKRIQYDLKISNPLTEQIKKDNPDAFEIAVLAGKVISSICHKPVADDELGYLALHFALALERLNKPVQKNIIIVCASGAGSSQILLYKVKSKFKDYIDEVLVTEAYKLPNIDQSHYDLILSTIPLPFKTEIPVIQVQYFLDENNIIAIENQLKNNQDISFIQNCFRQEFFYPHLKAKNKEEAIQTMCKAIDFVHPLPDDFYQLILEREAVSPTEYGHRVAIPHPIRLVMDETFVAVGILDKPIKWEKKYVKFIFMLCINKNSDEALSVFNEVFSSLILDEDHLQKLERHPDFKTIQQFIRQITQEKAPQFEESIFQ